MKKVLLRWNSLKKSFVIGIRLHDGGTREGLGKEKHVAQSGQCHFVGFQWDQSGVQILGRYSKERENENGESCGWDGKVLFLSFFAEILLVRVGRRFETTIVDII